MSTHQPRFALVDLDVALGQLGATVTQGLDLPAFEREPGFDRVLDEKVVTRPAVCRDQVVARFFRCFLRHRLARGGSQKGRDYTRNCLMWNRIRNAARRASAALRVFVSHGHLYKNRASQLPHREKHALKPGLRFRQA